MPGLDEQEAAQRVTLALSAVYFPALFSGLYRGLGTLDSEASRQAYVQEIARQALDEKRTPT